MECPNCKTPNPNENRFCGACSAPLTDEIVDIQAFIRDEFPRQVERAIDTKLLALADREVIEVKATEQVINRVWTWATRFATVVGVPVVVVVSILGFFGFSTIEDIDGVHKELKTLHDGAKDFHRNTNEAAGNMLVEMNSQFSAAKIQFATLEAQAKAADDTINKLNGLEEKMTTLIDNLQNKIAIVDDRANQVGGEVNKVKGAVDAVITQVETVKGQIKDGELGPKSDAPRIDAVKGEAQIVK